ncbi:MAG: hypothetical protein ACI87E_003486 [Mariniblastus sp.]|jgi:hypothetical protein
MNDPSENNETMPDDRNERDRLKELLALEDLQNQTARELLECSSPHQRAILRVLAMSDATGIDPSNIVLGILEEQSAFRYVFAQRVQAELEEGHTVQEAVEMIPDLLSDSSRLALRVAREGRVLSGLYAAILSQNLDFYGEPNNDSKEGTKALRLVGRVFFVVAMLSFLMLKVMPEFMKMFEEFGLEFSDLSRAYFGFADGIVGLWFLFPVLLLCLSPLYFRSVFAYLRSWNPLTWRQPLLSSSVLQRQDLAIITQSEQPILAGVSDANESKSLSRYKIAADTGPGTAKSAGTWERLADSKLINSREAKSMAISNDRNTQAWLLRWSAQQKHILSNTRSSIFIKGLSAVVHTCVALSVAATAIVMFQFLTTILNSLSS